MHPLNQLRRNNEKVASCLSCALCCGYSTPCIYSSAVGIFFCAAIYGIFGVTKEEEDDGDGSSVSPSIKRQLLKANRALKRRNYVRAEKACHQAMALLANSKHAQRQPYIEASAIVMDKVIYA